MNPINNKCRLCLNGDDPKGLVNAKTERTGELIKKINLALTYQVTMDNNLPQTLCKECYMKILDIASFQMKCLENETAYRQIAGLPAPESTKQGPHNQPQKRHTLTDEGLKLLRNNICTLNDKIALLDQEKELLISKIAFVEKENDALKNAVVSHSKSLPQITKSMSSLLSRMEQQFLLSHSRIIDADVETSEIVDAYIVPEMLPQIQPAQQAKQHRPHIESVQQVKPQSPSWSQTQQIQPQTTSWALQTSAAVASIQQPQVAFICDSMVDHVTEVEIDCEQPSAPSPRCSPSPSHYEDERPDAAAEVNALLLELCEQQEKSYHAAQSSAVSSSPSRTVKCRKTDHYEVVVPRKSFRRAQN